MKTEKKKTKITHNNKGITLIALVVTIVVLIILATISINLVMNGNIIGRAEKTSGIQDKATLKERLELIKATTAIDNRGVVTVDNYIKAAIEEGVADENEIEEKNDDGSQNFVTDNGWSVNVAPDPENPNNVIITIDGKDGELKPIITKIDTSATKTSITVKARVRHLSGGTIEYYYKLTSAADSAYVRIENITDVGATVEELTEGTEYSVRVVVKNKNGEEIKETSITTTKTPVEQITLNKTTETVIVGKTVTLTATVLPTNATNKNVIWTSSDSSIAEVNSNGIVTGRKRGTATITAAATDGSGITSTCTVTVKQLVEKITLDKTTVNVIPGTTVTFTLTVLPTDANNKNVTWTSSNPSIATVSSTGEVTTKLSGTATITAAATDGSGVTSTCTITIKSTLANAIGTVDSTKNRLVTDDYGNRIVVPAGFKVVANGTSKVTYTYSGTGFPSVQDGIVVQDGEGNQFVWIPVGNIKNKDESTTTITLGRYTFLTIGQPCLEKDSKSIYAFKMYHRENSTYQEGTITEFGKNATARALGTFLNKARENGGYYLGRYEASKGTDGKVDSKYNKSTWTRINQIDAATAARKMYSSSYYESDLVNSYAWDTTLAYVYNYSGKPDFAVARSSEIGYLKTGDAGDVVCNIWDLSNYNKEWTTEYCDGVIENLGNYCCTVRGRFNSEL